MPRLVAPVKRNERSTVAITEYTHELRELARRRRYAIADVQEREADSMNAYEPLTVGARAVDALDLVDDLRNRTTP